MIVFVSNFYSHHQSPFSRAMYELTKGNYRFIATAPISRERVDMGWTDENESFVIDYNSDRQGCQALIDSVRVVIYGSADEELFKKRLENNMLTFKYCERPFKAEPAIYKRLFHPLAFYGRWGRYKSLYHLSAGYYSAEDYHRNGTFLNRSYKWGYFPQFYSYSYKDLFDKKRKKEYNTILWVGRLISWKHPEFATELAAYLKSKNYSFKLDIIGNGDLFERLGESIKSEGLDGFVELHDFMRPDEVRAYMEKADIFIFTSDRGEGWGAVLNEAMNSGCAVVASRQAGATPYLIAHGENGLIYDSKQEFFLLAESLLNDSEKKEKLGKGAYETINSLWNADVAARRLLSLIDEIESKGSCDLYSEGPCSKAD